jgi:hypothetical protein
LLALVASFQTFGPFFKILLLVGINYDALAKHSIYFYRAGLLINISNFNYDYQSQNIFDN